ncbi:MAG TPA: serine hydrolase, partial [Sphingomonas sp.]|nr:serine hydrolase [Sphingomonas sp.]
MARFSMVAGLIGSVAGCGPTTRPGASASAPLPSIPIGAVSIPVPAPAPRVIHPAPPQLTGTIAALARSFQGKFGIAVRAVDENWTVQANARQKLPQQSVSKLWVALTLLDLREQGKARLDQPIVVRPQDLTLFHQPIAYLVKGGGYQTTVGSLLSRALT